MSSNNQNQRLNGLTPFSYIGCNADQPTNFTTATTSPTSDDSRGFSLGDWWLNTSNNSIWYLAATNGLTASWINVQGSGSGLLSLTANSGGTVFPELENINVVGDGATIDIVGNPGTSTLTMSLLGGVPITLTGNSGGAVGPTLGNITVVGSGTITVSGSPGTSTLTISQSGSVAESFNTQSGTAVPVAGILNVLGSNNITTSAAGSTITVTASSSIAQSYITNPATAAATPVAGVLTLAGTGTTTVSASGSTITISNTSSPAVSYSEGSFSPVLTFNGVAATATYGSLRLGRYVQIGNLVFIFARIETTALTTASGTVGIGGLPFTVSNSYGTTNTIGGQVTETQDFGIGGLSNLSAIYGLFVANTTYINFYRLGQAGNQEAINRFSLLNPNTTIVAVNGFYYI